MFRVADSFLVCIRSLNALIIKQTYLNGISDEFLPPLFGSNHGGEFGGTLIPTADSEHGLEILVVSFQTGELGISTCQKYN